MVKQPILDNTVPVCEDKQPQFHFASHGKNNQFLLSLLMRVGQAPLLMEEQPIYTVFAHDRNLYIFADHGQGQILSGTYRCSWKNNQFLLSLLMKWVHGFSGVYKEEKAVSDIFAHGRTTNSYSLCDVDLQTMSHNRHFQAPLLMKNSQFLHRYLPMNQLLLYLSME